MQFASVGSMRVKADLAIARKSLFLFNGLDTNTIKAGADWMQAVSKAKGCAYNNDGQTISCTPASGIKDGRYYPVMTGALASFANEYVSSPSGDRVVAADSLGTDYRAIKEYSVHRGNDSRTYSIATGSALRASKTDNNNVYDFRYHYMDPDLAASVSAWRITASEASTQTSFTSSGTNLVYYDTYRNSFSYASPQSAMLNPSGVSMSGNVVAGQEISIPVLPALNGVVCTLPVWRNYLYQNNGSGVGFYTWYNYTFTPLKTSRLLHGITTASNTEDYLLTKALCPVWTAEKFVCESFDISQSSDIVQSVAWTAGQSYTLSTSSFLYPEYTSLFQV